MAGQPQWLDRLTARTLQSIHALDESSLTGCHVFQDGEIWEVSLFLSSLEIVGGQHDGERLASLFIVDIVDLIQIFDSVESASWQPHQLCADDDLGSHLAISGEFEGQRVWLRILPEPPEQFGPGRIADIHGKNVLNSWE